MKRYEVDFFGDDAEHIATLTVYGETDAEIDAKLAELPSKLANLDEAIESEQAFAALEDCESDEQPDMEDWEEEEDDGEDDEDEDENACAVGVEE